MNVEIKITCGLCGLEMEVKRNIRIYDHELEYTAWCPECHSKLEDINRAEDDTENQACQ